MGRLVGLDYIFTVAQRRNSNRAGRSLHILTQPKTLSNTVGIIVLMLALAIASSWVSHGWELTGLSGHEFRQAQTALTIQAMQQEGFHLDYPTPVLGKPWSIPMEFPLYQYLVVNWAGLSGQGIAQAARSVSVLCFLVGLVGCYQLMRIANFSPGGSCLALVLVVFSPVYLFFSRTVMIESLAWASSAWFLWGVLRYRQTRAVRFLPIVLFAGSIAVLVKATTWAAFCLPWAVLFVDDLVKSHWRDATVRRRLWVEALGIGVPLLLLGFAWVAKADAVKAQNPIAHFLLSSELRSFNFGTWQMRIDGDAWRTMVGHWDDAVMPWPAILVGLVLALWLPASRRVTLISLVAFLGIQLVFFNLYLLHDYYFYANGVFLTLAVGVGVAAWWDRASFGWKGRAVVVIVMGGMAFNQFSRYQETLYPVQTAYATGDYGLTQAIRRVTQKNEVIVTHSPDWNSSIAYFTERRMLMIPDAQMYFHPDKVRESVTLLAEESVPLVLMMRESREHPDWIAERIDQLGLWPQPVFEWEDQVTAYARADRYADVRRLLKGDTPLGITMNESTDLLPIESRVQFAGTELADQISQLEFVPDYGVLPFGIVINSTPNGNVLLAHATSELYFKIPIEARRVEVEYSINPASYTERDFDGMSFHMEVILPDGEMLPLKLDWISPQSEPVVHRQSFDLRSMPAGATLLFRALPGPQQSNAYDQGLLHRVQFFDADQTTGLK